MAFLFISLRMNGLFVSLVLGLRIVSNTRFPFFSALCLNICFSAAPTPILRVLIEERRLCRFSDMICLHYLARQKMPLNVVILLANNVIGRDLNHVKNKINCILDNKTICPNQGNTLRHCQKIFPTVPGGWRGP